MSNQLVKKIGKIFNTFISHSTAQVSTARDQEGVNIFLSGRNAQHRVVLLNEAADVIGNNYRLTGSMSINVLDNCGNMMNVRVDTGDLVTRTQGNWWSIPIVELSKGELARNVANKLREAQVPAISLDEMIEICEPKVTSVLQAIAVQPSTGKGFQAELFGAKPRYDLSTLLVILAPSGAPNSDAFWTNERTPDSSIDLKMNAFSSDKEE